MKIRKPGQQVQYKFRKGQESPEGKSRQTESRQMQSSKTEGRSGYQGRDKEMLSGADGRSGSRTSIRTECWRVVHDATTIWQRMRVEELVKSRLGGIGESNDLD